MYSMTNLQSSFMHVGPEKVAALKMPTEQQRLAKNVLDVQQLTHLFHSATAVTDLTAGE